MIISYMHVFSSFSKRIINLEKETGMTKKNIRHVNSQEAPNVIDVAGRYGFAIHTLHYTSALITY